MDTKISEWNRIGDPDQKPSNYSFLIFDKDTKNTHWREDSSINKDCWENWTSTFRKAKLDPCLLPSVSQLRIDQRLQHETLNSEAARGESINTLQGIDVSGAGEMVQRLGGLTAHQRIETQIPAPLLGITDACNSNFKGSSASFWVLWVTAFSYTLIR